MEYMEGIRTGWDGGMGLWGVVFSSFFVLFSFRRYDLLFHTYVVSYFSLPSSGFSHWTLPPCSAGYLPV